MGANGATGPMATPVEEAQVRTVEEARYRGGDERRATAESYAKADAARAERPSRPCGWAARFVGMLDGDAAPNVAGLCLKTFRPKTEEEDAWLDLTENPRFARIFETAGDAAEHVYGDPTTDLARFAFDFVFVAEPAEQAPGFGYVEKKAPGE